MHVEFATTIACLTAKLSPAQGRLPPFLPFRRLKILTVGHEAQIAPSCDDAAGSEEFDEPDI